MSFVLWCPGGGRNVCVVRNLEGYGQPWKLTTGDALTGEIPEDAVFRMDPDYPKNTKLSDSLKNSHGVPLISQRLRDFLEARSLKNVEFLRVSIINHKDRLASDSYYILNPIEAQDCLDLDESQPTYNAINKKLIAWVEKLAIDHARVDPEVEIFRIENFDAPIVVRQELADAIDAQEFSSVAWLPVEGYRR